MPDQENLMDVSDVPDVPSRPPVVNRLLAGLTRDGLARSLGNRDVVYLDAGQVLHETGQAIEYLYFPEDSLVSLLGVINGRSSLEVGLVGAEGVVGVSAVLGRGISQVRAVVQTAGTAVRIKSEKVLAESKQSPGLQYALRDNINSLLAQAIQIAVCSRFHPLEARLARSLLATRDQLHSGEFHLTHEFMARALGVRRVGVTKAAGALQKRKLISYSRGAIKILVPVGLESASCECYRIVKDLCGTS
jgi:CRP-like cAMP-binding protein